MLIEEIRELNRHHYENCKVYRDMIRNMGWLGKMEKNPCDIFVHCNLFKYHKLQTGQSNKGELVLTSSGTTGKLKSQIYADFETRLSQQKALRKLLVRDIVKERIRNIPYYVISSEDILRQQNAKYAAVKGFSMLSKQINFLLSKKGKIRKEILEQMEGENSTILIFGFTYDVYKFLQALSEMPKSLRLSSKRVILLHGGGWKKMEQERVSNTKLNEVAKHLIPNVEVINYYGMIEQPGSIYIECRKGFFHDHEFGTIITRDNNLEEQETGKKGIVQVISTLPKSYPGHSILTEDTGTIYGKNCCECGNPGKYFKIQGRLSNTQLKGCSDAR